MKNIVSNIITGLGIGYLTVTVSLFFMMESNSTLTQFMGWMIASALYGIVSGLFEVEKINNKLLTLLHFLLCFTITITTGYFLGYGASISELISSMGTIFLFIYLIIYTISYCYYRYNAKKITEKLNENF